MKTEEIKTTILNIIHEATNIPKNDISENTSFVDELEIDSLTLLEIAVSVDQEYGLNLPEDEMVKMTDLKTATQMVLAKVA